MISRDVQKIYVRIAVGHLVVALVVLHIERHVTFRALEAHLMPRLTHVNNITVSISERHWRRYSLIFRGSFATSIFMPKRGTLKVSGATL